MLLSHRDDIFCLFVLAEEQRRPSYGSSAASAAVGMPPAQHAAPVAVAPPPVAAAPPSGPVSQGIEQSTVVACEKAPGGNFQ